MRYLKHLALLAVCMFPAALPSQAQFAVGVRVGSGYGYVAPVCSYGYYGNYPYACAPYGYYSPEWFTGGVFIGAGPWFHGFRGRPGFYGRGFYERPGFVGRGRGFGGRGDFERGGFERRGFERGGFERGGLQGGAGRFHDGGSRGRGFHGGGRR